MPVATPSYSVIDLGALDGDASYANAIDGSGEVVGASKAAQATAKHNAFLKELGLSPLPSPNPNSTRE